ncbi:hypothetical protein ACT4R9_04890 [Ornithobacterium rhinotracheale]
MGILNVLVKNRKVIIAAIGGIATLIEAIGSAKDEKEMKKQENKK